MDAELPFDDHEVVRIMSSDDVVFESTVGVVKQAATIRNLIADCDLQHPVPLPNVDARIMSKVLEFLQYHAEHPTVGAVGGADGGAAGAAVAAPENPNTAWNKGWCAQHPQNELFELILAANYLDIEELLDATCTAVAGMMKGKTTEELRATFNIKNDFTPEEEEQIRKENAWCEER